MFNVVALADVAIRVRAQSNETIECALSIRAVCVYVYVMRSLHIEWNSKKTSSLVEECASVVLLIRMNQLHRRQILARSRRLCAERFVFFIFYFLFYFLYFQFSVSVCFVRLQHFVFDSCSDVACCCVDIRLHWTLQNCHKRFFFCCWVPPPSLSTFEPNQLFFFLWETTSVYGTCAQIPTEKKSVPFRMWYCWLFFPK